MKKTNKKNRWLRSTLFLVVFLLVAALSFQFLAIALEYSLHCLNIRLIESDAEHGYITANGRVTWTDAHIADYKEAVAQKKAYVETNDVANFLYHLGSSLTGKLFRLAVIIAAFTVFAFSLMLAYEFTRGLINGLVFSIKRSIRRAARRHR